MTPGSFVLGILQARILEWVASPSPGDSPSQGWNLGLLPCVQILYCLSSKGSPYINLNVNQNTIPEMWNFLVGSLRKIQTENCSCLYSSSISCAFWIKLTTCVCVVSQSRPTLWNRMDCSPSGSSVHGDFPSKNTGMVCHALFQEIFPTQESNPGLPHCRQILYRLSHQGSPH